MKIPMWRESRQDLPWKQHWAREGLGVNGPVGPASQLAVCSLSPQAPAASSKVGQHCLLFAVALRIDWADVYKIHNIGPVLGNVM